MSPTELAARLESLGYFGPPPGPGVARAPSVPHPAELDDALSRYAYFHGLGTTDAAVVARHMALPRCGLPDYPMRADAGLCRWPHKAIRFWCGIALQGFSATQVNRAYRDAIDSWGAVCDIRPVVSFGPTAKASANVVSESAPGDGQGGTLAWSYLPCGATEQTQLKQSYDTREPWTAYGLAYLQEVIAHEVGHALGLDHLPAGSLMQPYATGRVVTPQSADIAEVVRRYGKAVPAPGPTPDPTTPLAVLAEFAGTGGYKLLLVKP